MLILMWYLKTWSAINGSKRGNCVVFALIFADKSTILNKMILKKTILHPLLELGSCSICFVPPNGPRGRLKCKRVVHNLLFSRMTRNSVHWLIFSFYRKVLMQIYGTTVARSRTSISLVRTRPCRQTYSAVSTTASLRALKEAMVSIRVSKTASLSWILPITITLVTLLAYLRCLVLWTLVTLRPRVQTASTRLKGVPLSFESSDQACARDPYLSHVSQSTQTKQNKTAFFYCTQSLDCVLVDWPLVRWNLLQSFHSTFPVQIFNKVFNLHTFPVLPRWLSLYILCSSYILLAFFYLRI